MIVGVGGQGPSSFRILGSVLMYRLRRKGVRVHGMSQRGGSVVTVKFGKKFIPHHRQREADFILSFERLEAARWLSYLKEGGKIIVNDQRISPMPVITGAMEYPGDILAKIKSTGADLITVDALSLATQAGSSKSVNVVLIGLLSSLMDIPVQAWQEALKATVKPKFLEVNRKAFELGRKAAKAE